MSPTPQEREAFLELAAQLAPELRRRLPGLPDGALVGWLVGVLTIGAEAVRPSEAAAEQRPDPDSLEMFRKLPLERRRAEAAKRIEMHQERLNPELWYAKIAALEAASAKRDAPEGQEITS